MSAAVAGTIGPVLFGSILLALSVLEYDFMLGIGWRPVANPAGAWPSGLALGPYGPVQVANFVVSGLLLVFFSLGAWPIVLALFLAFMVNVGGRGDRADARDNRRFQEVGGRLDHAMRSRSLSFSDTQMFG